MTRQPLLTTVFGVALCALLAAAPSAAFGTLPGWTVTQITTATSGFENPCVSPDLVAMRSTGIGMTRIWAWWPTKTAAVPLQTIPAYVDLLAVSGDRALWRQQSGGQRPLMTWAVGGPAPTAFTKDTTRDTDYLAISNGRIAWLSTTLTQRTILTQTLAESKPTALSASDNGPKIDTQVSGNRVVWSAFDGLTWQIYTRAVGESAVSKITADLAPHISPQVSGDRIVWMSQDGDGNGIVCTWKKGDRAITKLGSAPYDGSPQVSGDRVVWVSGPSGDSQVHLWEPLHTQTVTSGPHWISAAHISGDRLVWSDGVDGRSQIVTWRAGESSLTTLATSASFLDEPVVGGDRVAWRALGDTNYQIFMAAPIPKATSLTLPTVSPTKPTHGRTETFRSYLSPGAAAFTNGAKGTLYLYRKESGHWRLRNTVTLTRVTSTGGRSLLYAGVKPRYAGSWKALVTFSGSMSYAARTSSPKYFTVR